MNEKAPYLGRGHTAKEVKIGNSVCRICDDFCVTQEETQQILDRIAEIAVRSYERKGRTA